MTMDILKQLNWVDVLTVVILIRIVYISAKTGFVTEFMKMFGVLASIFFAFHFYVKLAGLLGRWTDMDAQALEVVSFGVIWMLVYALCLLMRSGVFLVFTVQTLSLVDRWGAAVASVVRFLLTTSMLMFLFLLTDVHYMEKMTFSSYSQQYVIQVAPNVYKSIVNGFVMKFFPNQGVNPSVANEFGKTDVR